MVVVLHSPPPSAMSDDQAAVAYELDQLHTSSNNGDGSLRSRASSVISTGTKFSISTMPQQGNYHIDGRLERSRSVSSSTGHIYGTGNPRSTAMRPWSVYSTRSIATSLPPYEAHQPLDASLATIVVPDSSQVVTTHVTAPGLDSSSPPTPSTVDPENSLSMHYGRVVRHIDETHRRQVARINQAHEQDLAATRDAIDKVYRKEFKAKDREMERVRAEAADDVAKVEESKARELDGMREDMDATVAVLEMEGEVLRREVARLRREMEEREEGFEKAIERACNAIEDLWEGRWNDRTKLAAEEVRRHVRDRDEKWLLMIQREYPELVDNVKFAMNVTDRRPDESKEC